MSEKNRRLRGIAYAVCMLLGVGLVIAVFLAALPPRPLRLASIHPASTVGPLMGFSADSVFNTGTAKQLDALPGIGEVLSNRIVEDRAIFGVYRLPEDLMLVKGIGPKKLSGIMDALAEPLLKLPPAGE